MDIKFYIDIYWDLKNTHKTINTQVHKKLDEYGVTWTQFHALAHISHEGISVNCLAKELGCNSSNVTGIIDRMSDNGWVLREHSKKDRRVWKIKLTDKGEKIRSELIPKHHQNIKNRMSVLNDNELATLKSLLTKLRNGGN